MIDCNNFCNKIDIVKIFVGCFKIGVFGLLISLIRLGVLGKVIVCYIYIVVCVFYYLNLLYWGNLIN